MSDLNAQFEAAQANSKLLAERPDNPTLLKIYGLFKQATEGDNTAKSADSPQTATEEARMQPASLEGSATPRTAPLSS